MPRRRISAAKWEDVLQQYVPIPLDDGDPETIRLASAINGKELSDEEVQQILDGSSVRSEHWTQ